MVVQLMLIHYLSGAFAIRIHIKRLWKWFRQTLKDLTPRVDRAYTLGDHKAVTIRAHFAWRSLFKVQKKRGLFAYVRFFSRWVYLPTHLCTKVQGMSLLRAQEIRTKFVRSKIIYTLFSIPKPLWKETTLRTVQAVFKTTSGQFQKWSYCRNFTLCDQIEVFLNGTKKKNSYRICFYGELRWKDTDVRFFPANSTSGIIILLTCSLHGAKAKAFF